MFRFIGSGNARASVRVEDANRKEIGRIAYDSTTKGWCYQEKIKKEYVIGSLWGFKTYKQCAQNVHMFLVSKLNKGERDIDITNFEIEKTDNKNIWKIKYHWETVGRITAMKNGIHKIVIPSPDYGYMKKFKGSLTRYIKGSFEDAMLVLFSEYRKIGACHSQNHYDQ